MPDLVMDAWGIIAWLKGQRPAADQVRLYLEASALGQYKLLMNTVNLGEVFYISAKFKSAEYADFVLQNLRGRIIGIPATDDLVMNAAKLKSRYAISYADAFAAATAVARSCPLVTGDPELLAVSEREEGLTLKWIGEESMPALLGVEK